MRIEYEIQKVEEVEGGFNIDVGDDVPCPMCEGIIFHVLFDANHHVDLYCIKCQTMMHFKTVN